MIAEGQVILFRFPQTDKTEAKLRPALVLNQLPGPYNDWLICMISSQLHHAISDFDEVLTSRASDFEESGLKSVSVIRISRLAVVDSYILLGKLGQIDKQRLTRIKRKIASWIEGTKLTVR
ncbi:MAG: type II toxin-antitoxin system PemK/MazF family toxin [Desulfobacteraceae bacterium]|nr:MAG: type II toxin-antitoxin system PemK/MazF family toxin [Desulfobacteraceae bacterium]